MASETVDVPEAVRAGYTITGAALNLGPLLPDDKPDPTAMVRVPLAMMSRHGLVAGATGKSKTKTLQVLAEQLSTPGVPYSWPTSRATSPAWRCPVCPVTS